MFNTMRVSCRVMGYLALLAGCQHALKSPEPRPSELSAFETRFFSSYWPLYPTDALQQGLHDFDASLPAPDPASFEKKRTFFKEEQKALARISQDVLTPSERMDYALLRNVIEKSLWELDAFRDYEWDPAEYNIGSPVALVLEGKTKSEPEKLKALGEKLDAVPAYYAAALKILRAPARELTELARRQNQGLLSYLDKDVTDEIRKSSLSPADRDQLLKRVATARAAVEEYVQGLALLMTRKNGFRSFRIGPKLYRQKFSYALQSGFTSDALYRRALQAKAATFKDMVQRSKDLWPKYFSGRPLEKNPRVLVKTMLARLSDEHVKPAEVLPAVQRILPELAAFVERKDLLTLDKSKPLTVRPTPSYERGSAMAGVDAPGPFDTYRDTYYDVLPIDDWAPTKQMSFLREYNNYTLQILNMHEAIPGHYVQLIYGRRNPSLVKQVFGSDTMIEGWAVYCERMMLEEGYGGPELWLMFDKWHLREIANVILDHDIQAGHLDRKGALKLMRDEAFQEDAEAEEKWNRATYSQVQLASYFAGSEAIRDFREELKQRLGPKFRLKDFHEALLNYGNAPVTAVIHQMKCDARAYFPGESCAGGS